MALVYDYDGLIAQLNRIREGQLYTTVKDPIAEQVFGKSPPNYDTIYSSSLERDFENPIEWPKSHNSKRREEESSKKVKVHLFEPGDASYRFMKDTNFRDRSSSQPSPLSLQVEGKQQKEELPNKRSEIMLLLTIFTPLDPTPVKIRVGEQCLVEEVIATALKECQAKNPENINNANLPSNPKAYLLRCAEDDGTPDDDMPGNYKVSQLTPAPARSQKIGQFKGCDTFAVCKDAKYKGGQEQFFSQKEEVPEVEAPGHIRILLPNEAGFLSVIYKNSMLLRELREVVCSKRCLPQDQYMFQSRDGSSFLPLDTALRDLTDKAELQLVDKRSAQGSLHRKGSTRNLPVMEEGDAPARVTKLLGPMFFFTPTTATRYKQYTVVKANKFSVRQERLMGIDEERITNMIPDKKGSAAKKVRNKLYSTQPVRFTKDVVRASLIPNKPRHFLIEFKDKTYKYEANQAEEIVAKLNYILQMNDTRGQ